MAGEINTFSEEAMRKIARSVLREERKPQADLTRRGNRGSGTVGFRNGPNLTTPIYFENSTDEIIPAYACMRVISMSQVAGRECFIVGKLDGSEQAYYLVNGQNEIAKSGRGNGTWGVDGCIVLLDDTGGTPTVTAGDSWGATSGEWYLTEGGSGFIVQGLFTNGNKAYALQGTAPTGVKFRNESGYTIPRNGIMKITDYHENSKSYVVGRPDDTFQRRYLVNGDTECLYTAGPDYTYGTGRWLDEAGYVKLNSSTGASLHSEWGAKSGFFEAYPNRPGFHLVKGNETIDGANFAFAIQREVTELIGKVSSTPIAKGATGAVQVWIGASGAEVVSEYSITAYAISGNIGVGLWVNLGWINGNWYVTQAECG